MNNSEYKEMMEEKYGKPLKDIMYELCVEKNMSKWEGSKELGVPEKTFLSWRTKFRFGPDQLRYDRAEEYRKETIKKYEQQISSVDLNRDFVYKEELSLRGFKELCERMLELEKYKRSINVDDISNDLSIVMKIGVLESTIENLKQYEKGELYKRFYEDIDYMELSKSEEDNNV
ncbi:hypothetical protein N0O92_22085 [Alkalihalobacillus sp. MEB130]|uniref:hypothetical protein n=1 Tax=Alkalihalobacillus sp. MEB130 TaxID=2976704 RepID=UPI0028DE499B|nr:hypothetical protein [Alkalihalobacillus sp. MEB130]MDT8862866.1 hypothetical protein [Alkalihalobacillus sp. MEB130]